MRKLLPVLLFFIISCFLVSIASAQQSNKLTKKEKKEGWKLLFNGKNLKGWHSYHHKGVTKDWKVQNGAIIANVKNNGGKSDLETDKQYSNFDLKLEWKMKACSNSGIMFHVNDSPKYKESYFTGPEMQIASGSCKWTFNHKTINDAQIHLHRAGDLYDLVPVDTEWVKPAGKWNKFEIRADNAHLKLFENGHKVVDTKMYGNHWRRLISRSKFSQWPDFGTFRKGHITFQGTEKGKIWFRDIKIKIFKFGPTS
ncbi:MAG TPA: DUF1080 domain-containing protein [Balneolaceae bacterium]|nr:DUF1080 domain-containing protein [Balneolaceae bacterium]